MAGKKASKVNPRKAKLADLEVGAPEKTARGGGIVIQGLPTRYLSRNWGGLIGPNSVVGPNSIIGPNF